MNAEANLKLMLNESEKRINSEMDRYGIKKANVYSRGLEKTWVQSENAESGEMAKAAAHLMQERSNLESVQQRLASNLLPLPPER